MTCLFEGRALLAVVSAAVLSLGLLSPVSAGPSDGGFTSENVEWIRHVSPTSNRGGVASFGGRHLGSFFYLTGAHSLTIYDTTEPSDPQAVGLLELPGNFFSREDPDTNGEILLTTGGYRPTGEPDGVLVIDVRDKSDPKILSMLPEAADHTYTCVLDCTWAYTPTRGLIIDLRDPRRPEIAGSWSEGLRFSNPALTGPPEGEGDFGSAHDLTEVAPGVLLTGSAPMYLLDARHDPRRPRVLARSDGAPYSYGSVAWPHWPGGRVALSSSYGIVGHPRCEARDALAPTLSSNDTAFRTWRTSGWRETRIITGGQQYRPSNGTYADGDPAVSGAFPPAWGCMTFLFDWRTASNDGILVALGASGHGLKFLHVTDKGKIREAGFFLAHGGASFSGFWINEEIVYALDHHRGLDVLRYREIV